MSGVFRDFILGLLQTPKPQAHCTAPEKLVIINEKPNKSVTLYEEINFRSDRSSCASLDPQTVSYNYI